MTARKSASRAVSIVNRSIDGDSASLVKVREMVLRGPCVVSGIQNLHAEELVFVRNGTVDIFEVDGQRVDFRDDYVTIEQGQRYHLHVTSSGKAKILTAMVPAFLDADKVESAKASFKRMILY